MDKALGSLRARLHGRSYWSLRYADGTVINEWDMDWSRLPLDGRRELRLYAPNGKTVELSTTEERKLFQFKCAEFRSGVGRRTTAHVIGVIDGPNGECECWSWDYDKGQLLPFRDNVNGMTYQNVGSIALSHVGLA